MAEGTIRPTKPVALRRVNSDTVSIAVVGSASESASQAVGSAIEMDKYNTIQYYYLDHFSTSPLN